MVPAVEKISPTALLIAHFRSFTDIPFARDVALATGAREASLRLLGGDGALLDRLTSENAPQAEARYKSVSSAILRSGAHRVLELGCGIAMRGVAITEDPAMRYVSTDLPGIVEVNRALLRTVPEAQKLAESRHVWFEPLDVLADEGFEAVVRHLGSGELAVVCEGLLGYFSRDELAKVAASVHASLCRRGGVWITPDLFTREQLARAERPATREGHRAVERSTERRFTDAAFESNDQLVAFFGALGFSVETRRQLDGGFALSSLSALGLPPNHHESFEADLEIRTLRPI